MKTLTERLNMAFGEKENAQYVIRNNISFDAAESAVCAITYGNYTTDYEAACEAVYNFLKNCNEDTGSTVSIWLS